VFYLLPFVDIAGDVEECCLTLNHNMVDLKHGDKLSGLTFEAVGGD
jgi:hypothetical protein